MTRPRYLSTGVLSRHAARRVLGPYQGLLYRSVIHGWAGWEKFGLSAPDVRAETGSLTRASVMSDLMSREAVRLFKSVRGVDVSEPYGRAALCFAGPDRGQTARSSGLRPLNRIEWSTSAWIRSRAAPRRKSPEPTGRLPLLT